LAKIRASSNPARTIAEFYADLWETITRGEIWRSEIQNRKKNGELFWELAAIAPVTNQAGEITHFMAVKEDITARKRQEAEQVQQERLAAVGQLAAGIAHDFNNILGSILLYAQLAGQTPEISPRNKERMQVIESQTWHASRLIEQILDFSRRGMVSEKPLNLLPLLKEQIKLLSRTLPEHIRVAAKYDSDNYQIQADPTRMQQMITNLAVNARDAMSAGGELRFELRHLEIGASPPVTGLAPGDWICLSVTDTGTGIPADVLPHIYEPFFTTKKTGEGSGLGLSQVYGIVGQHGGYIDVRTEIGAGTTFFIYLPALAEMEPDDSPASRSLLPTGAGKTLLLVEDDAILREVLVSSLEQLQYRVLVAEDGRAAVTLLTESATGVDLILSDVVMPKMGGVELFHTLRDAGRRIPLILLSGHPWDEDVLELRRLGAVQCLQKPIKLEMLAEVVAGMLKA
jgi:two-component system cell cycle sensor histidine kinase/response regulator CckA